MSPAMPTSAKLASGRAWKPIRLIVLARMKPAIPPTIRVGPKVPPTPPPALVKDMAKTFRINASAKYMGMTHLYWNHLYWNMAANTEFSSTESG